MITLGTKIALAFKLGKAVLISYAIASVDLNHESKYHNLKDSRIGLKKGLFAADFDILGQFDNFLHELNLFV